jgi:hypothetical protein
VIFIKIQNSLPSKRKRFNGSTHISLNPLPILT